MCVMEQPTQIWFPIGEGAKKEERVGTLRSQKIIIVAFGRGSRDFFGEIFFRFLCDKIMGNR